MNFAVMSDNKSAHKPMTVTELFSGLSVTIPDKGSGLAVTGISVDSRTVRKGDLFIAVPGHSEDGRKFISEAVSLGYRSNTTAWSFHR